MIRTLLLAAAVSAACLACGVSARQSTSDGARPQDWPAYGGSPSQTRYSSLRQITRENVGRLQVAWTYDTGESGGLQTQPIVVDGVLYAYTPTHETIALDAATGRLLWTFDSGIRGQGPNRGVMYWSEGDDRRVFAAVDQYLYALDARTGQPIPAFGDGGRIDLREHLGRSTEGASVRLTSPGVVYRDLVIVGGRVSEGLPASPGDVRAYDVRTGALRWSFHSIPHPGEFGDDTWPENAWTVVGGANSWPGMALDEARGIVYVPTGSAASDFVGSNRAGDNLFANCLIALDAATGERIWHYQFVHHDIWDRDLPSPPVLVTLTHDGRRVDAVAQATKHGYVFVFDRVTGEPLFPIDERPFPETDVPGETTAPTQPIPRLPEPFARQRLTADLLTTRTPEAHAWALERFQTFTSGGQFVPLAAGHDTVVFPGYDGGAEWGGQAVDPETGIFYVNANDLAWTGALAPTHAGQSASAVYLRECAACHRDDRRGTPPAIASLVGIGERRSAAEIATVIRRGAGRMPGFAWMGGQSIDAIVRWLATGEDGPAGPPADDATTLAYRFTGYRKFLDPDGYPATAPPWGTLTAIDLDTGAHVWRIPFGEYPALAAAGMTETGTENYGGPVVTAGGVVFIGATNFDKTFRAFDKATGRLLWKAALPFSGNATPAVYEADGRQFVVIGAGGGKDNGPSGGVYVAFALPRD